LVLSVLALGGATVATEPIFDDRPAGVDTVVPVPEELGATPIEPDPTVRDPRPHAWDRVVVHGDGVTLDVFFWMGIEACNGLHSVTVTPSDSGIDLQLMTGQPAGMARDTACIEIAQLYVTTVTLDEPLITQYLG
jgi:hypothetical protein